MEDISLKQEKIMEEEISVWDKTQAEITMEEQVKIMLGVALISAAIPVVFAAIGYGISSFIEKRKRDKLEKIVNEFKNEREAREQD
jgi:hypothetical protein